MKMTKSNIRFGEMWAIVVLAWGMLVWPAGLSNAQWSQGGGYVWTTNPGDKVGIGTPMPAWELEVANLTPGEGAEVGVTANDATGAIAAYSSTLDASFGHYAGRVSLFAGLETPGLDLRADGGNGDIRFYTGGFHLGNERMRIINTGAVGIGTKNPLFGLHIKRGSEYPTTLGVEWEQVINWEEINKDWFYYSVGGSGLLQEGGTNMIFNSESVLRFSTQDDMGTGPITEHMRLTGDGKVGIGTTTPSPSCKLHVVESPLMLNAIRGESHGLEGRGVEGVSYGYRGIGIYGRTYHPAGWAGYFSGKVSISGNVGIGEENPNVALDVIGSIEYTGTITDVSDDRLKENITTVNSALDKIQILNGVYFNMMDTPEQTEIGLIAQNVQEALPEAVRVVDAEQGYLGISYPSLIPVLIEAIKEQQEKIDALEKALENKKSLEDRIVAIEAKIRLQDDVKDVNR